MATTQPNQLGPAQPAVAGEQDQRPVASRNRVGELVQLRDAGMAHFGSALSPGALHRALGRLVGLQEGELRRLVRISYAKVAEFQRRGAIHFHAVIRLDAATDCRGVACLAPPPAPTTSAGSWNRPTSPPETGRRAALVVGASFSHHAQGGGIWPDGAGMPDPSRKRPTNQPEP
jgi:hypothetical protein